MVAVSWLGWRFGSVGGDVGVDVWWRDGTYAYGGSIEDGGE